MDRCPPGQWRIHYHMPLFVERYGALASTRETTREVLRLLRAQRFCPHLEIETYTWEWLPPELKARLAGVAHRRVPLGAGGYGGRKAVSRQRSAFSQDQVSGQPEICRVGTARHYFFIVAQASSLWPFTGRRPVPLNPLQRQNPATPEKAPPPGRRRNGRFRR